MKTLLFVLTLSSMAVFGQPWSELRQAQIRGGGGDGKCTIEVEVDGVAEVEINQTQGRIRTLSGQPSRWRRFECNQPIPANADIRFRGIDGRGNQALVSDPRRGGSVIVRIDDPQGGAEGYTFDLEWGGRGGYGGGYGPDRNFDRGYDRGPGPVRIPDRAPDYVVRERDHFHSPEHGDWVVQGRWSGIRGSAFRYHGDGRGFFNRLNGRDMPVEDVIVSLSPQGRLVVEFEAVGFRNLIFVGQARQISRYTVTADLYAAGYGREARGVTTVYLDRFGQVERITMNGRLRDDSFRLNWSAY